MNGNRWLKPSRVGVIALPEDGAIRVSYGGVPVKEIPALVAALARHLR